MPLLGRRRSKDSSSSSSSSSSSDSDSKKHKKDKKNKKHHQDEAHHGQSSQGHFPTIPALGAMGALGASQQHLGEQPPQYMPPHSTAPSGDRIALTTTGVFPTSQAGQPACYDADRHSPIYVGSALFPNAVHPCKIAPHLSPPCRVPYGGGEHEHHGRYDLLPLTGAMEWVHTSNGNIPHGRQPVDGGYEDNGAKLYHARALVGDNHNGVLVPGKTGTHLGGCNVAFGGGEHVVHNYEILRVYFFDERATPH